MTTSKVTAFPALTAAGDDDVLYVIDDPGGTPVSKKITAANLRTSLLTAIPVDTTVAETDDVYFEDTPGGTPTPKKVTLANLRTSLLGNASVVTTLAESGGVSLADGTKITLAELRKTLFPNVIFVKPSGDTTGATDTAAIQAAINSLQASLASNQQGIVLLSGSYYTNAPLTFGSTGASTNWSRVALHGIGTCNILYYGSASSDYMIRMIGTSVSSSTVLRGFRLFPRSLCRGILCTGTHYGRIQDITVYGSVEAGIDIPYTWCIVMDNVHIQYPAGFGLRINSGGASHLDSVFITNQSSYTSSGAGGITTAALQAYSIANGGIANVAAWDAAYQAALVQHWPSDEDSYCVDYTGALALQASSTKRAVFYCSMGGAIITNFTPEGCTSLEYPIVYLAGTSTHFRTMRTEDNWSSEQTITITGHDNVIDNVNCANSKVCECFARATGDTWNNRITGVTGGGYYTDHVLIHDGGRHQGNIVTECCIMRAGTTRAPITRDLWMAADNDAEVIDEWWDGLGGDVWPQHPVWQTGVLVDSVGQRSGNYRRSTLMPAEKYSDDVPAALGSGNSVLFDGTTDFYEVYTTFTGAVFTLAAWVKPATNGANFYICDFWLTQFYISNTNRVCARCSTETMLYSDIDAAPVDTWTHVAWTHDGTTGRLYINGVEAMNTAQTQSLTDGRFFIGTSYFTPTAGFNGLLDDVRIYSSALSAENVVLLAAGSEASVTPYSRWTCDEP